MTQTELLAACKAGIKAWQEAFNDGDAEGCAAQYHESCIMHAKPFGTFEGKNAIQKFWQEIINQGYKEVAYTDVTWEQVDDNSYLLTSKWTMNKAFGVVHKEHWKLDVNGVAKLASDDFEILGER